MKKIKILFLNNLVHKMNIINHDLHLNIINLFEFLLVSKIINKQLIYYNFCFIH